MIDDEVIRLRRLRDAAMKGRAIAEAMNSRAERRNSIFARSGLCCWQIVRAVTGRLRAHPYLNYQRGPSEARAAYDRIDALVRAGVARYRGLSFRFYTDELRRVARELDDLRAVTWSGDLSDDLGRSQARIHKLVRELEATADLEAGSDAREAVRIEARAPVPADGGTAAGNWPYLNF